MFDLARFVERARSAALETDAQSAIRELLDEAMAAPNEVLRALGEPTAGGFEVILHSESLTILNMVWRPHMVLFPHDHRMWTSVGIYTGREDNIFWRKRTSDAGAQIEASGARSLSRGDTTNLGRDVIHSVTNPIPRLTGALHIYGGDFFAEGRSQWDPESLRQEPLDVHTLRDTFAGA